MLYQVFNRRRIKSLCIVIVSILALSFFYQIPVKAEVLNSWPTYQHDLAHFGFNQEEKELKPPLALDWSYTAAFGVRQGATVGAAVSDGIVYAGAGTEVVALESKTGRKIWSYPYPNPIETSADSGSLAFGQGVVYAVTDYRKVYAFDARSGTLKWTYTIQVTGSYASTFNGGPISANGLVYWGTMQGDFFAVREGKLVWTFATGGRFADTPTYAEGKLLASSESGLFALNPENGTVIWAFKPGKLVGPPVYDNSVVYVGSHDSNLYAVEASTGNRIWAYKTGESIIHTSAPAIAYGMVYFASADQFLYSVDAKTGTLRWKQRARLGLIYTPPAVANGFVYIGNGEFLQAFDAQTGKLVWEEKVGANRMGPLAIAEGRLFVGTTDGKILAYKYSGRTLNPPPQPKPETETKRPFGMQLKYLVLLFLALIIILALIVYWRRRKNK